MDLFLMDLANFASMTRLTTIKHCMIRLLSAEVDNTAILLCDM